MDWRKKGTVWVTFVSKGTDVSRREQGTAGRACRGFRAPERALFCEGSRRPGIIVHILEPKDVDWF